MLTFKSKKYKCSEILSESILPSISYSKQANNFKSTINDFEGLFIGYGNRETGYPYSEQNLYTDEKEKDINIAVLENDDMYAEFLVDFGGRLWKLYDKKKGKDVLYTNDVIRVRNLSIRNAWFSGGVEWNCGVIGHTPFTCKRMYCAKVKGENGEDVIRFYEFERIREIYYQVDFWLDKNKLMVRVRIQNPNSEVVPMYWWSNMATPEFENGRVVVPADSAYNNSDGMGIKKSKIPVDNGIDVSYPENIPDTIDYFYDIPEKANKFIANVNKDGNGLLQMSSNLLKGRKLFSWGHREGSDNWQKTLTDKAGYYVEIQAGLGKTQYECLPMPPKTTWSFLECYTLADIDAKSIDLNYVELVDAVNQQVENTASSATLDALCQETENTIACQKGEIVFSGSGFGYFQNILENNAPNHLVFTEQDDISMWLELTGKKENSSNVSFAIGNAQNKFLLNISDSNDWRVKYQLALLAYDKRDYIKAKKLCEQAFILDNNFYLNHLYSAVLLCMEDKKYAHFAVKTLKQKCDNYSVCESIFRLLLSENNHEELINCYDFLSEEIKSMTRIKMYLSFACLKTGDVDKAEALLLNDGGLVLLDFREGDKFLDNLYRGIRNKKYGENPKTVKVPKQFDFIVVKQEEE